MSTGSPGHHSDTAARKDRPAPAAQACQTCRNRKSKCDEARPRCGLCTRLNIACIYRETVPTKKDKTMVHILQTLERVEHKLDRLSLPSTTPSTVESPQDSRGRGRITSHDMTDGTDGSDMPWGSKLVVHNVTIDAGKRQSMAPKSASEGPRPTTHTTASHRILLWPAIWLMLNRAQCPVMEDIERIAVEGSPWFIRRGLGNHSASLPGPPLHSTTLPPMVSSSPAASDLAGLSTPQIRLLVDAYFDTFNMIHPILDRESFYAEFVTPAVNEPFLGHSGPACLLMNVLALGHVAIDGVQGQPLSTKDGQPSGLRGGTTEEPPGLRIFNEARYRFGFVMYECTLENVQIYLLQAMYHESNARHLDLWRCCSAAAQAFQSLVRCEQLDWNSPRADVIRRVYWTCILLEDFYHVELDLPKTGIYSMQDQIGLPNFDQPEYDNVTRPSNSREFHYHFLATIALRRLISRIHHTLHPATNARSESSTDYDGGPMRIIDELARQLDEWRLCLPQPLKWSDDDRFAYPSPNPMESRPSGALFSRDTSGGTDLRRDSMDVLIGFLRTRFYYARYLIYRPLIFKALHYPELMTEADADYCAIAIQSACMWPMTMSPCKDKKRLVPYLFTWTQSFMGILLVLRMRTESDCLRTICEERVRTEDIEETIRLLLDWIGDIAIVDGVAGWAWQMMDAVY